MEKPEDYVREFERDFPDVSFTYAQRMKLLALFELAIKDGKSGRAAVTIFANETYGGWL